MHWEDAAKKAVDSALESVTFGEVRGVVILPYPSGDPMIGMKCDSMEALQRALEERFNEQWCANVPFDSGKPVCDGDSTGYVTDKINYERFQQFFAQFEVRPRGERLFRASETLLAKGATVLRVEIQDINDELIRFLADKSAIHAYHGR